MAPQDTFIDDDDDCCPLCVEEFDLSDKNFRPCPCGYQVCQFCFNNIKNNINGLCPACRRPYDEKTIEWKVVTPEEVAQFKANVQKNAKKKAEIRQKEAQKREVESLNRKHLQGLRVVQKNLVYVVGLSPGIRDDEMLQTLRGDKYFGQYGKIIKIVVSKAKPSEGGQNGQSLGIYVTFARKEDAARCIAAVNGSQNGDRILRAQLGTTKYCSAYLRNEVCTNKQCMFLHEPGDNDDSYSRQDLSSINSVNTQRPLTSLGSSSASSSRQIAQAQAPIQQAQPVAAAQQPMVRDNSKDGSESGDGSALPSSASWANKGAQRSRRGSHATSGAASSPAVSPAVPVTVETVEEPEEPTQEQEVENTTTIPALESAPSHESSIPERDPVLLNLLRAINSPELSFTISNSTDETTESSSFPPLFDGQGGQKRRAMRQQQEARHHIEQESQLDSRSIPEPLEEDEPESGSLQLGGEPEDNHNSREGSVPQGFQRRPSTQLPIQRGSNGGPFGPSLTQNFPQNLSNLTSINGRTLTPMQQQQLLAMKTAQPQSGFLDQLPPGMGNQLSQGSVLFQQQGHNRQSSRYSFANDSSSAASVKPSANPKLMAQQSSMMPSGTHTQQGSQFYGSTMPGPPPGLKSSGTPPIGGMFGHGFAGSMSGGSGFRGGQKDSNSEMLQDMLRSRGAAGSSQSHDAGKQDQGFPSLDDNAESLVNALVSDSIVDDIGTRSMSGYGGSRSSTPVVPPGFEIPHAHSPALFREDPIAKPSAKMVATSAEFTPTRGNVRTGTPLSQVSLPPSPLLVKSKEASISQAKQDLKSFATNSGLSKAIASQAALQAEDFPALDSNKGKSTTTTSSVKPTAATKTIQVSSSRKASIAAANSALDHDGLSKSTDKRPTPGVLTIPTQPKAAIKKTTVVEVPAKSVVDSASFPPLQSAVQSPLSRNTPKTLRVLPTPKAETPAGGSATPSSVTSMFPPHLPTSRQPSLASVSRLERPGTPTSEVISDNASITSTSMSRASSPPPTRVGSAPVRATTKSMQKKQRREAQKEKEKADLDAVAAAAKVEPEVVEIAPIMGRKKKQKKEKAISSIARGSVVSTPAVSRAPSPGATERVIEEPKSMPESVEQKPPTPAAVKPAEPEVVKHVGKTSDSKGKGKAKVQRPATPEAAPIVAEAEDVATEKPIPTPASVLQDLISSGIIHDIANLSFFKNPGMSFKHQETPIDMHSANQKLTITPEDRAALLAGRPVHKIAEGPSRILLTPNGDCVRNLTNEEEERYLDLQARIAEESGPAAFFSAKHHAGNGFTLIGGRAVPNGPPPFFPLLSGNATPMDPVGKIQRDEALSYINQYVLPSLSANSQLEKALNANALDTDMLRSNDAAAWASWGSDPAGSHHQTIEGSYGAPQRDGILAAGLETMTAHFPLGRDLDRSQPLGNVSLLSLTDAETAMQAARKEAEGFEKKLNALLKKNRRLLLGSGH